MISDLANVVTQEFDPKPNHSSNEYLQTKLQACVDGIAALELW